MSESPTMDWGPVTPVYPDKEWTPTFFTQKLEERVSVITSTKPGLKCCDRKGWCSEYTEQQDMLHRYRTDTPHDTCAGCSLPKGVLEDNRHMVLRMMGPRGFFLLQGYWEVRNRFPKACTHGVSEYFKARTGLLKMGGEYVIRPTWREECYWEMGYGYTPFVEEVELVEGSKRWLGEFKSMDGPIPPEQWESLVYQEIRALFREEWKPPERLLTLRQWIASGRWMDGRSGTGRPGHVTIDGMTQRTPLYKGVAGAHYIWR